MEKHPNLEVGRAPISLQWRKKLIMVMKKTHHGDEMFVFSAIGLSF